MHVDVKRLGRIQGGAGKRVTRRPAQALTSRPDRRRRVDAQLTVGWEYVHIAVDDYSRLAYAEVLPDEKATTAIGFLRRAVAFYRRHGITVERLLTDNGSAYVSALHALACRRSGSATCAHAPTGRKPTAKPSASSAPCSPAGPTAPSTAQARNAQHALDGWLWHYNHRRRHSALGHQPPVSRTNLLGSYT